jgi:hypothetical protein
MAMEPEWDIQFSPNTYGFRPEVNMGRHESGIR